MNLENAVSELTAGEKFTLQFATATSGPWTVVGTSGSSASWRGFDNALSSDGATLSAALLTNSNVLETYEEFNDSAGTPNAISSGQRAEWDWVLENNDAVGGVTYYFRIVKNTGTPLNGYTRYPQVATRIASLEQKTYRAYQNNDSNTPTVPLAAQDVAATGVTSSDVIRLRISIVASDSSVAAGEGFKLQHATSTGGPWTDVGGIGSGSIWRAYDNATPSDGSALPSTLLSTATTTQTYEEANNAVSVNPIVTGAGSGSEWDWVVQDNNASPSTAYYFRMVKSAGLALDSYANYVQVTTDAATLTQNTYRWYDNIDAVQPTAARAAENTATTDVAETDIVRLRLSAQASAPILPGQVVKLQHATSTGGPWMDVGGIGSVAIWRGFDNASTTDGVTLSATLLSTATTSQTYEEANSSAGTPNQMVQGTNADGEWDWVVQNNGVTATTTYYFRMVYGNDALLDGYNNYPQLQTAAADLTQQDYRLYQNADSVQPTTPLAGENTPITGATDGTVYRIRVNLDASGSRTLTGETFKLQFATSTGGIWTDVGATTSSAIWRGFDNATPNDGATLSAELLIGSDVVETYEEHNSSAATPNTIGVGQQAEWDWVVQNNGALATTTYYFRTVYGSGAPVSGYTNYPQITTAEPDLAQSQYRWYQNIDAAQPTTSLASEDTPVTGVESGDVIRLRISLQASTYPTLPGQEFRLQHATDTGGPWTDVGAIGSGEIWRGFNNANPMNPSKEGVR